MRELRVGLDAIIFSKGTTKRTASRVKIIDDPDNAPR